MIKASELKTRDAAYGNGVYFTRLNPATDKKDLSYNNWRKWLKYLAICFNDNHSIVNAICTNAYDASIGHKYAKLIYSKKKHICYVISG